jgi:hypothetical protein
MGFKPSIKDEVAVDGMIPQYSMDLYDKTRLHRLCEAADQYAIMFRQQPLLYAGMYVSCLKQMFIMLNPLLLQKRKFIESGRIDRQIREVDDEVLRLNDNIQQSQNVRFSYSTMKKQMMGVVLSLDTMRKIEDLQQTLYSVKQNLGLGFWMKYEEQSTTRSIQSMKL